MGPDLSPAPPSAHARTCSFLSPPRVRIPRPLLCKHPACETPSQSLFLERPQPSSPSRPGRRGDREIGQQARLSRGALLRQSGATKLGLGPTLRLPPPPPAPLSRKAGFCPPPHFSSEESCGTSPCQVGGWGSLARETAEEARIRVGDSPAGQGAERWHSAERGHQPGQRKTRVPSHPGWAGGHWTGPSSLQAQPLTCTR